MSVKKVGKGKFAVVHCHGKKKGRRISKATTKKHAQAIHGAIQASKHRRGKA